MANHKSAPTETTSEIRGEDWYGDDVSGHEYANVLFRDVDMTELVNQGAAFTECVFRSVRFNASKHADAAFLNCSFSGCAFFDAEFIRCKFVGSRFERSTFDLLKVDGGDWSFVGLAGGDLRRASFTDVRMRETDLSGVQAQGGAFVRADLSGAWLQKANFAGCDLRGSDLTALDPLTSEIAGAIITWDQAAVIAAALGLDVRAD